MGGGLDENLLPEIHAAVNFDSGLNSERGEGQSLTTRLSTDVRHFLAQRGEDADTVLCLPIVQPPPVDDSYPLLSYFISSSHNTYLLSRQVVGRASAASYTHVLRERNGRCVEIDVWPSANGPIVTHGYTLSTTVPFDSVCAAIGAAVTETDWPVWISLECHVNAEGQPQLVEIMRRAWGDKLVTEHVRTPDGRPVAPRDLKGRILLMVEYYPPEGMGMETADEEQYVAGGAEGQEPTPGTATRSPEISEELAALGVYCRSMKPPKDWITREFTEPRHLMLNISESALDVLLPHSLEQLVTHAAAYSRRVYPRGSRIESDNLDPSLYWRAGSQVAALNWQTFDHGMQLNEALFVSSPGYVLKPREMLDSQLEQAYATQEKTSTVLSCDVAGLSSLPFPDNLRNMKLYVRAELIHSGGDKEWYTEKKDCVPTEERFADVLFDESFEFEFDTEELVFVRLTVNRSQDILKDEKLAMFCARVDHLQPGWRVAHLMDMKGKDSGATLLVRFGMMVQPRAVKQSMLQRLEAVFSG